MWPVYDDECVLPADNAACYLAKFSSLTEQREGRTARMISRSRCITTALLLCQQVALCAVLTTRLRAEPAPQNTGNSSQSSAVTAQDQDQTQTQQPAKPPVSATSDTGAEDTDTEHLIQNELQQSDEQLGPPRPATNVPLGRNEVLIRADQQEKNQDIYHVRGNVEIRFGTYTLNCDQADYDSTTGQIKANGHVLFQGGPHNDRVMGSHAVYDVSRDTGTFYDAIGSTGVKVKNRMMFLTSSTPFFFTGKVVDRLGPDRYRVNDGYVTSCQLPKPKWQLDSKTALVEVGEEAVLHHATLKVDGIPVFYFPFVEHPVDNLGRKSGFLIPQIGTSNLRGFVFGDAFYWAISRNADATIGAELFTKRGSAQLADLRMVGYTYALQANYFGVIDSQGDPTTHQNQGGQELKVNAWKELPWGFRGVLSADYLSSYLFRLAFGQSFTEAINSEVRSYGFVFKHWDGFGFGVIASSYRNYESSTPGDYIEIVHSPGLELSTAERPISGTNFVYSFDAAPEGVSRNEPGFQTASVVGRLDAAPYLAWPKLFHGWTIRPQVGVRETWYSQRLIMTSSTTPKAVSDPINRNVANASFELRPPTLAKVFSKKPFGRALKHTIEPYATYRYQTGINDFSQIIRFDERDILADTNEVEYGIVNRLYAKKTSAPADCFQPKSEEGELLNLAAQECEDTTAATDVLTWEVAQKYYGNTTFGGAVVPGSRNVFDSTIDFTGIAFLTNPRRFSPVISRVRAQSGKFDVQWALDYDPVLHQLNASTVFAGYRWGNWYFNGGQTYLNAPGETTTTSGGAVVPSIYNQYRVGVIYGSMSRRGWNGAASVGVDSQMHFIQSATVQTNYNWDCCGVAFQYQRFALGSVRNENAYRFSFSLANVGSFGTIRRLQRLY
jgi:LPS-assembly protein